MCVYPADAPTLSHPAWPCLFSLLMGVTNGYFGSVPMIQAAGKVPPEQRELAGEGVVSGICFFTSRTDAGSAGGLGSLSLSLSVSREHHDGFLHDGLDGGLHRGVRGLQLHHSGTQDPHSGHARTCQRYGVLTADTAEKTRTRMYHTHPRPSGEADGFKSSSRSSSQWIEKRAEAFPSPCHSDHLHSNNEELTWKKKKKKTQTQTRHLISHYMLHNEDQNMIFTCKVRTFWGLEIALLLARMEVCVCILHFISSVDNQNREVIIITIMATYPSASLVRFGIRGLVLWNVSLCPAVTMVTLEQHSFVHSLVCMMVLHAFHDIRSH